jgi:choline kinase
MTTDIQAVILAAGMGTRLGRPFPKPLTELSNGQSIMAQQIGNLRHGFGPDVRIMVVVGFKHDMIMERFPDVLFAYNECYDQTNTSKSLLRALELSHQGGVLWLNGDVVFDARILDQLRPFIESEQSVVCVNRAAVADEEVKYTVDPDGFIAELSKTVADGLGEAVGINFVADRDKAVLVRHLAGCADNDYFERGIETAIAEERMRVCPLDITELYAVEVDFEEDLDRANQAL